MEKDEEKSDIASHGTVSAEKKKEWSNDLKQEC